MNKRNTEGYVLAYLLIVITVIGFISATLMASTLQVVQSQEKSIQYMQDKYAAMGEIERLVGEMGSFTLVKNPSVDVINPQGSAFTAFLNYVLSFKKEDGTFTPIIISTDPEDGSFSFHVSSVQSSVMINATIVAYPDIDILEHINEDDPDNPVTLYGYKVTGTKAIIFENVTITGGTA